MLHTFGTDVNGGLVFERPTTTDGTNDTAAPPRPPAGTVVLTRDSAGADTLTPSSFTTDAGGHWTYQVDDDSTVLQIDVSPDNGATWIGPLTSAESLSTALVSGENAASAIATAAAAQQTAQDALSLSQSTGARSVNGKTPDATGAVTLVPSDIGALSAAGPLAASKITGLAAVATTGKFTDLSDRPPIAIPLDQKGAPNGVATLGPDGKVPSTQVPDLTAQLAGIQAQQDELASMAATVEELVMSVAITSWVDGAGAPATMLSSGNSITVSLASVPMQIVSASLSFEYWSQAADPTNRWAIQLRRRKPGTTRTTIVNHTTSTYPVTARETWPFQTDLFDNEAAKLDAGDALELVLSPSGAPTTLRLPLTLTFRWIPL